MQQVRLAWYCVNLVHVIDPATASDELDALESYVLVLAPTEEQAVDIADKMGFEHDFRHAFGLAGAEHSARIVYKGVRCSRLVTWPEFFPCRDREQMVMWNRMEFENEDDVRRFIAGERISALTFN